MASNLPRIVARLFWLIPVFLGLLAAHQVNTALDLRHTMRHGELVTAEVLEVHQENRVDITYDYVSLRVPLAGGRVLTREKLSLPHTLITQMVGKETVDVRVLPGADQEIVIAELGPTQWRIAAINALISGLAALCFAIGVFAWNRYLRRKGDPARQPIETDDAEHPAGRKVRAV